MNSANSASMNKTTPSDELYLAFGNAGICPSLVAVLGFKWLLSLLAFASNLSLLWLTIQSSSLHSNCNILIALNALNIAIFSFGPLPPFLVVLSGRNFISAQHCFPLQLLPLATFYAQIFLCLAIGIDRLLSVLFPIFYRSQLSGQRLYVFVTALLCYFYSMVSLFQSYSAISNWPDRPVMCSTTDIALIDMSQGPPLSVYLNLITPICYLLLGGLVRFKLDPTKDQTKLTRQIFRAIFVLMLLQLFGWLFNQLLQLAISLSQIGPISAFFVRNIGAYPLYICLALDAPALYLLSQDYRKAFIKHFQFLSRLFQRQNSMPQTRLDISMAARSNQINDGTSRMLTPRI